MTKNKTIVFIHGMFVNDKSWNEWRIYFEQLGYRVLTPANPAHEGNPAELRQNVHPNLAATGFEDVVRNIERLIDTLPEKPIVVGHSMAGLVVQKLVERGKAAAGVSIDGAPPKNIMAPLSTIKIVWPAINFFKGNSAYLGTQDRYDRAFFNTLAPSDRAAAYNAIAVPESRKIGRDTVLRSFSKVDFAKPHVPLLFVGGERDTIFPPSLTKRIAESYPETAGRVDYHTFAGRSHFICGEPGWEEVASFVAQWLESVA